MGSSLSNIVERLHPLQEGERLNELRRLLRDQQFSSSLIKGSKSAGLSILIKRIKPKNVKLTKNVKLASLQNLKEDSLVWKPDKETIERWSANISTFWISPAWTARFLDGQLGHVYDSYFDLATRQGEDVLRIRFSVLFFYDLLCLLYPQHSRSAPPSIYERFAKIIKNHSTRDEPLKDVISTLSDLVGRGRRYNKLTETFGSGILVELPIDVSRSMVETKLPLDDQNAYNNAVKGIVGLNLKRRAEENGSDKLAQEIRKAALTPFQFLVEDPTFYNHRRTEIEIERSNYKSRPRETDNQVLNPAANALILLRNSSGQSNSDRADQLRGVTSCYNITSSPNSFSTVSGIGEGNGTSAAQLPRQDQLQGESPNQTTLISTVQRANISTKGPATLGTTSIERNAISHSGLGQAYNTSIGGISDLGLCHPPSDNSPSLVQDIFPVPRESLEVNSQNGASCDSVESSVLSDINAANALRSQWDAWNPNTRWENAGAFRSQWDAWNPNTGWENIGEDALRSQRDLLNHHTTKENNELNALDFQCEPLDFNIRRENERESEFLHFST